MNNESLGSLIHSRAMAALHDVAAAAGGITDLDRLASLTVERARDVAGGEGAVLRWYEEASNSFRLLASVGTGEDIEALITAKAPTAISGAFKTGQPVVMNDYKASGRTTPWGRLHNITAQVAVPLLVDARPAGTLAVLSYSDHRYEAADALFLSLLAAIVAPAIENARLASEVKRQARSVAQIYEALPVMVVVYGRDGTAIQHNSAAEAALGKERLTGVRERSIPLIREDGTEVPADERPFAAAMRSKRPVRGTVVGYGAENVRWAYIDAVPLLDERGEVEAVVTSSVDITRLKAAEDKERKNAQSLRALIDLQAQLGAMDLDAHAVMRLVAERAVTLTDGPGAAVLMVDGDEVVIGACSGFGKELEGRRLPRKGNPLNGCLADGNPQSTADSLVDPRCGREVFESMGIRSLLVAPVRHEGAVVGALQLHSPEPGEFPDGTMATLELVAGFAGEAISRARAAAALRESEQLFSGAFQASGIAMAMTDVEGVIVRINPAYTDLLGYTEDEILGRHSQDLVVADDLTAAIPRLKRIVSDRADPAVAVTMRVRHRDGHTIWTRVTASIVPREGLPPYILTHVVDLTEERRAEAILRSEQERLGEVIEAQRDIAAAEVGLEGLFHAMAERMLRLLGRGAVAVLLPDGEDLVVRAAAGEPELKVGYRVPIGSSLAGSCYRTRLTQRSADLQNDPRAHHETARTGGLGAGISTPLISRGEVVGVVQLMSARAGEFDDTDARTVEMVAAFTAAAFDRARTLRQVQASEQRTRAVMESAPDPIVVFDSDGRIADFNPAAERAFLRRRDEVVGESAMLLLAPKHLEAFQRWNRAGREANSAEYAGRQFEATGLRSDGSEFPIEIAVTDLPEETRHVACFIRDLTMRDRLQESVTDRILQAERQASMLAALSEVGEGLVTTEEGRYVSSNDAYLRLTGYSEAELRAMSTLYELVPVTEREELAKTLRSRMASGDRVVHTDSALVTKDGRRRTIEGSIIRVTEEGVSRLLTIVRDVTDQRRAEEAQRESDAKSRLMAMMNHEVRTPLNSILGFAQLLTDTRMGDLNEKQRRYVANIRAAGDHLLQLANDSLDMAKLDAGRAGIVLGILQVDSVIAQAVEQVRPMAISRGLSLAAEPAAGVQVHADARHLTQVLLNLLSNAIRHTRAGEVKVFARLEGESVAISVTDTGDGISKDDLTRIFEEFFQGGNHAPGGIGLGLSISKRLVHLMGGSIAVESELGKGSTFTVRLARAPAP